MTAYSWNPQSILLCNLSLLLPTTQGAIHCPIKYSDRNRLHEHVILDKNTNELAWYKKYTYIFTWPQRALVSKISIERLLFVISFLFILQKNSPLHTWQISLTMQMNFSTPSFIFALIHPFFHLSICFFHPLLYRMRLIYTHLTCLCMYTKSYVAIMLRNILKSLSRFLTC